MWELVRHTERFSFVPRAKVEHAVFYPDTEGPEPPGIWHYEVASVMGMMVTVLRVVVQDGQTRAGVAAVRRWAGQTAGVLGPEDVVISADVDEVLSRAALHHLRHCGLAGPVLSGALVMPLGNLDTAFRSDYPVAGRPHSYAEPTIYQVSRGVSMH